MRGPTTSRASYMSARVRRLLHWMYDSAMLTASRAGG